MGLIDKTLLAVGLWLLLSGLLVVGLRGVWMSWED
jgi:hypothetical protein